MVIASLETQGMIMRILPILLTGAFLTCLTAESALAAIKYKRFPQCTGGAVDVKTCECHAGTSSRYHFCHAGNSCDTNTSK